jgi:hypothetical protein
MKKPIARNHPRSLAQDVVDQAPQLRKIYKLGSERINWYLFHCHGIKNLRIHCLPYSSSKRYFMRDQLGEEEVCIEGGNQGKA